MDRPETKNVAQSQSERYSAAARAIREKIRHLASPAAHRELTSLAVAYEVLASFAADREAKQPLRCGVTLVIPDFVSFAPLSNAELKSGETYDSWRCQGCQAVLALARRAPDADPLDLPDAIVRLKCPSCHALRHYTMHERRVRRYPWNAKRDPTI